MVDERFFAELDAIGDTICAFINLDTLLRAVLAQSGGVGRPQARFPSTAYDKVLFRGRRHRLQQ